MQFSLHYCLDIFSIGLVCLVEGNLTLEIEVTEHLPEVVQTSAVSYVHKKQQVREFNRGVHCTCLQSHWLEGILHDENVYHHIVSNL